MTSHRHSTPSSHSGRGRFDEPCFTEAEMRNEATSHHTISSHAEYVAAPGTQPQPRRFPGNFSPALTRGLDVHGTQALGCLRPTQCPSGVCRPERPVSGTPAPGRSQVLKRKAQDGRAGHGHASRSLRPASSRPTPLGRDLGVTGVHFLAGLTWRK